MGNVTWRVQWIIHISAPLVVPLWLFNIPRLEICLISTMEVIYIVPAPNVSWKSSESMWIVTHYVTLLVCQGRHDFCSSHFWSDCLTSLGNIVPWMVIYAAELWFDRNPSKLVCNGRKEKLIKWTSKADGPWKDIPFSLQREQRPQTFSEDVNGIYVFQYQQDLVEGGHK